MVTAHSPNNLTALLAPIIPAALPDGLVPADQLINPVIVTLPVWDGARPGYTYQLLWDGERTGPLKSLDNEKPGDVLMLEIPVEKLTEGSHHVAYEIMNPVNMRYDQ